MMIQMQWGKQCSAGWRGLALLGPVDGNESWALKWMGDSATSLQCKSWPVQWSTNRLQHGKDQVDLRDNINFRRKHESRKIMKIVMSVGVVVEYSPCLDAWWACLLSMWWRLGSIQSSISISKLISFSCAKWKRISTLHCKSRVEQVLHGFSPH